MTDNRIDRLERKIDRLTWLVIALITVIVGLVFPELILLATGAALVILVSLFAPAFLRTFFPIAAFNIGWMVGKISGRHRVDPDSSS